MEVHTFPKDISPKVNVIVQLQFKFIYHNVTVQYIRHYATKNLMKAISSNLEHSDLPQFWIVLKQNIFVGLKSF